MGDQNDKPETVVSTAAQPVDFDTENPPESVERARARHREALMFMTRLQDQAGRTGQEQASAEPLDLGRGIASAAVGMAGLVLADVLRGLSNVEVLVFFALDVLMPLFVLTFSSKAPMRLYVLLALAYLAVLGVYVIV